MLQALKEDLPTNVKCKDKFLIQSTVITPEKESSPLQEIVRRSCLAMFERLSCGVIQWNVEGDEVHSQKIRVVYLPPEGQTVAEEDETHANMTSLFVPGQEVSCHALPANLSTSPSPNLHRTSALCVNIPSRTDTQHGNPVKARRAYSQSRHPSKKRSTTMLLQHPRMSPCIPQIRFRQSLSHLVTRVSVLST